MMKIALIAAPAPKPDSEEPNLGQRDAELIADRLQVADLDFEVVSLDPSIDLAAQIDESLTGIADPIGDLVIYISSQLAVVEDQECFLCLDPDEPDVGDAMRDVGSAITGRAERILVIAELRHQDPKADHPTVRAAVTAIEASLNPKSHGVELIAAVRPTGAHIERIPSRLTVGLLEGLDNRRDGMTAKDVYARAVQATDLGDWPTGLIYVPCGTSLQLRSDEAPPVSEECGLPPAPPSSKPDSAPAPPADEPEADAATTPDAATPDDSFPRALEPPLPPISASSSQASTPKPSEAAESLPKVILNNSLRQDAASSPADETRPSQRMLAADAARCIEEANKANEDIVDEESIPISVDLVDHLSDPGPTSDAPPPSSETGDDDAESPAPSSRISVVNEDSAPISVDVFDRLSDPGPAPPGPPPQTTRGSVRWPRRPAEEMSDSEIAIADHVDQGDAARDKNELAAALKSYKRALGRFGTASTPERAQVYIRIGEVLLEQGKVRVAISNLEKALAIVPDDGRALESLIALHAKQKNWRSVASAEERFLEAAEENEETLERLLSFGERWLTVAENVKRATERFEAAAEMFPTHRAPIEKMILIHEQNGHTARVLELRHELVERTEDPRERAEQHHKIGLYCLENAREQEALAAFEASIDADPSFLNSLEHLASLLGEDQEWGELERIYQKVYDAFQSDSPSRQETRLLAEIQHRMALLYRDHLGDPGSALAALDKALEHRPRQVATLLLAGEVAEELDDPGQALSYLRRAVDLKPKNVDIYHRMFDLAHRYEEPHTARHAASATMVLEDATEQETEFYEKSYDHSVPPHRRPLDETSWTWLRCDEGDEGVERVMRALTPAVLRFRIGQLSATNKLPDLPEKGRQDPVGSTLSVIRSVAWAAQYLGGLTLPALYIAHKDDGGILAPIASESTVVFGREILSGRSLPELAFLTGRHLAMRQPKFELVVHMKSIDELSACFLAALKLVLGSAPPAGPLSKTVSTLASVLAKQLTKEEHAELKAAITAFSNDGGQADLRRWVTGVKRSATRAGFVLCGDLPTAVALLRSSCVTDLSEEEIEEHVFDLCRFAVSGAYLKISKAMAK